MGMGRAPAGAPGRALVADATDVWVSSDLRQVRRISKATGDVIVVAGGVLAGYNDGVGPSALFDFMRGIVSDGAGLLITDDDNNRLRRVS